MDLMIRFSRHARRGMQLYEIDETDVIALVRSHAGKERLSLGTKVIVSKELSEKYQYPLKVVLSIQGEKKTVVSVYPLRRGLGS